MDKAYSYTDGYQYEATRTDEAREFFNSIVKNVTDNLEPKSLNLRLEGNRIVANVRYDKRA